jgi:hypothetical protein
VAIILLGPALAKLFGAFGGATAMSVALVIAVVRFWGVVAASLHYTWRDFTHALRFGVVQIKETAASIFS